MQRIGRVNRIGSQAAKIYNYTFYPSKQGDKEIQLYKNALIKLQGFHSAFGEDAQIYSHEEIVKQFEMFDSNIKDSVDKKIQLLREVRELYNTNRQLYHKIKRLPLKSRVMRQTGNHAGQSIVFVSSDFKTEFYKVSGTGAEAIDFLSAVDFLRADKDEIPAPFTGNEQAHYDHVNKALDEYKRTFTTVTDTTLRARRTDLDRTSLQALKFLREVMQASDDMELKSTCNMLKGYVEDGVYVQLPRRIRDISREYEHNKEVIRQNQYRLQSQLSDLAKEYQTQSSTEQRQQQALFNPDIVISETFI